MKIQMPWGQLSAIDEGEGPLLLLLHPLAQSGELWRPAIELLSSQFHVIAPDARGHGQSDWDGLDFTVADLAEDVAAIIGHVNRGPASVISLSMGGCTAIALACRHPELVDRLVLADTTANYGPDKAQAWAARARNAVEKPRQEQLEFQWQRWFSPSFIQGNQAEVKRISDIFLKTDSASHAATCRALGAFDDSDKLQTISNPTLVIVGDEDYATPLAMAQVLADGIGESSLQILPQTRHLSLIQNRSVWSTVIAHLKGCASAEDGT